METSVIITFCALLLIAYLFDLSSSKTKIPSVILLFLLGWLVRQGTDFFGIYLPNLFGFLPILGTIGLILIVLEGSLELEMNRSKFKMIRKSFWGSLLSLLATAFLLAYLFSRFGPYDFKDSLLNVIPLCVISSSIAIPSVKMLTRSNKEFVIYESSFSDILGVIFFNFIAINDSFGFISFGHFGLQIIVITVVSFVATIGLSLWLSRLEHHIKFVPIILLVILIYGVSKVYHLPALVFILFFGLFIGNLDELRHLKWVEKFKPDELNKQVHKFKELTIEAAFLVRSLFFILFGYLLETEEIINTETLVWSFVIVVVIFLFRAIQLIVFKLPLRPLLFVAPRGLITILLFLSIEPHHNILLVNKSLIIQVIMFTSLIMMVGLMTNKKDRGTLVKDKALKSKEIDAEVI
ncbi:MAG: cation:proton antiporter [Ferruginibacter sp.]